MHVSCPFIHRQRGLVQEVRGSQQAASRRECKSCAHLLAEMFGPGEVETPVHFMFTCSAYHLLREEMWAKLKLEPEVAAKVHSLEGKSEEEKLYCMLDERFWGISVDEETGRVCGPFVHAFECVSTYVSAAWSLRNRYAHMCDVD